MFGSLGRFRANGPVAAHLWLGMRRIPLEVVLILARISIKNTYNAMDIPAIRTGKLRDQHSGSF